MDFRTGDEAAMGLDQETDNAVDTETKSKAKASATRKADKAQKAMAMESEDKGTDALVAEKAGEALAGAMAAATSNAAADVDSKKVNDRRFNIVTDVSIC